MHERIFTADDLPNNTAVVIASGVYFIAEDQLATFNHASIALDDVSVLHKALAVGEQLSAVLTLRSDPGVKAIAMLNDMQTAEDILPLVFSQYLTELRKKNKNMQLTCVISNVLPEVPPGYVRLPHLIAYRQDNSVTIDKAMWEVLTSEEAARWLGSTLPEQETIENYLPNLLTLRHLVRTGGLVNNDAYNRIAEALKNEQRYLSILFVYQHIDLFHSLFEGWCTIPKYK